MQTADASPQPESRMSDPTNPSTPVEDTQTMPEPARTHVANLRYNHGLQPYPQHSIQYAIIWLASDRERLQAALTAAKDAEEMSRGCLDMIWDTLVLHLGIEAMKGTPAMFYPEAINHAVANARAIPIPDSEGGA